MMGVDGDEAVEEKKLRITHVCKHVSVVTDVCSTESVSPSLAK